MEKEEKEGVRKEIKDVPNDHSILNIYLLMKNKNS